MFEEAYNTRAERKQMKRSVIMLTFDLKFVDVALKLLAYDSKYCFLETWETCLFTGSYLNRWKPRAAIVDKNR